MLLAEQNVPTGPTDAVPDSTVVLRARLIFEEALETIEALGVSVAADGVSLSMEKTEFSVVEDVNLPEVIKECCDLKVVTTGTLSCFGVPDNIFQELVDLNNLQKFGPGGHRHPQTGKWIKPENHPKPRIKETLEVISKILRIKRR